MGISVIGAYLAFVGDMAEQVAPMTTAMSALYYWRNFARSSMTVLAIIALLCAIAASQLSSNWLVAALAALTCCCGACVSAYFLATGSRHLREALSPCYELIMYDAARREWVAISPPAAYVNVEVNVSGKSGVLLCGVLRRRAAWEMSLTEDDAVRDTVRVRALYRDRLGNRLFQYCTARLRAAFLDVAFEAPPLIAPFGSLTRYVARWSRDGGSDAVGSVRHAALLRRRSCCSSSSGSVRCARCGGARELTSASWKATATRWLEVPSCQMDTRLFAGSESAIASWLRPALVSSEVARRGQAGTATPGPHDVAVHLRVGDIIWGIHSAYRPLPMSFYSTALRAIAAATWLRDGAASADASSPAKQIRRRRGASLSHTTTPATASRTLLPSGEQADSTLLRGQLGRVVVVTEHATAPIVLRTAAYFRQLRLRTDRNDVRPAPPLVGGDVVVAAGTVSDDLGALFAASNLVLSLSSFAWWPAFLSTAAHCVVVPRWGLLQPQLWCPDPEQPKLLLRHDMTLLPVPEMSEGAARANDVAQLQRSLDAALSADALSAAPRVLEVPLPHLQRWPGNFPEAVDALFDDQGD